MKLFFSAKNIFEMFNCFLFLYYQFFFISVAVYVLITFGTNRTT